MQTVAVAMSGGVDSTVCAALLQKQYDVSGFFMDLGLADRDEQIDRVCRSADRLHINLEIIDLAAIFQREIIDYFCQSYEKGLTPNPCVICNPLIKCGSLLDAVLRRGVEKMATGHYVRLKSNDTGLHLLKGGDPKKDQSYFLCGLNQHQLSHLVFPLGELTKDEVYRMVAGLGFDHTPSTESQDVCFLSNERVSDFLQKKTRTLPGDIVTLKGEKVGRHKGITNYTIGQRRGLGICGSTPYYVTSLSADKDHVIIGKEDDLWHNELLVGSMNWISGNLPRLPAYFHVKIRYRHQAAKALVSLEGEWVRVVFDEPQRAITPGQFVVLYDEEEVIGGGEIVRLCRSVK